MKYSESSTAKGVNIATEFNKEIIRHKMKRIQVKKHKIGTYEIDKISLSCFDDKVLDDGIHTLAYFYKDCNKKCDKNENNDDNNDNDNDNVNDNFNDNVNDNVNDNT